jgi:hypothetical protein
LSGGIFFLIPLTPKINGNQPNMVILSEHQTPFLISDFSNTNHLRVAHSDSPGEWFYAEKHLNFIVTTQLKGFLLFGKNKTINGDFYSKIVVISLARGMIIQ